ncbi:MAG: hypothetical protein SAL07_08375 [Oscillatoria sp. PMC 1051.18]|nr:hypothetical protein [Oscillatoria sp. PMC 1050.18]MEC5029913.1 hypothetical protein [Oscillatoria sp. PMC 1051.18]
MQQILTNFGQKLAKRLLFLALTCLLSLGGIFLATSQPSYAQIQPPPPPANPQTTPLTPEDKIDRAYTFREGAGIQEEMRQKSYEEELEAGTGTKAVEKLYEENLKEYKESNPGEGLVEKTKDAIENITGK